MRSSGWAWSWWSRAAACRPCTFRMGMAEVDEREPRCAAADVPELATGLAMTCGRERQRYVLRKPRGAGGSYLRSHDVATDGIYADTSSPANG